VSRSRALLSRLGRSDGHPYARAREGDSESVVRRPRSAARIVPWPAEALPFLREPASTLGRLERALKKLREHLYSDHPTTINQLHHETL